MVKVQYPAQVGQPRAYLGITYLPLNPQVAPQYGLDIDWGVLVTAVKESSPADLAGIRPGDVLLYFDDHVLGPDVSLLDLLWQGESGTSVRLTLWRTGKHYAVDVVLGGR